MAPKIRRKKGPKCNLARQAWEVKERFSAAIRSPGSLPARAFSLATSSSFHPCWIWAYATLPLKTPQIRNLPKPTLRCGTKKPRRDSGAEFPCSTVIPIGRITAKLTAHSRQEKTPPPQLEPISTEAGSPRNGEQLRELINAPSPNGV
jgi:hypothetical protein